MGKPPAFPNKESILLTQFLKIRKFRIKFDLKCAVFLEEYALIIRIPYLE